MKIDLSNIQSRAKKVVVDRSFLAFLWLVRKWRTAWSKQVIKVSMYCRSACFVETWPRVADGQRVDVESPLCNELTEAIAYYLTRPPRGAAPPGTFEQTALPHIYLRSEGQSNLAAKRRYYSLVHKFKIARTVREFANIQALINLRATEATATMQSSWFNETPSVPYWKNKVAPGRLPSKLNGSSSLARINSYLKKRIKRGKLEIARSNYPKLDFSLSDVGSFIAVSGTLLLLLGYLHVYMVSTYFSLPYQQYFEATDYLASSANQVAGTFLSAILAAGFAYFSWSTIDSYSVQNATLHAQSFSSRVHNWFLHFLGVSSLVALVVVYYRERRIDPLSFFVGSVYLGSLLTAHFCRLFFSDRLRAHFFLSLAYLAVVMTASDALRDIERVLQSNVSPPARTFIFSEGSYSEPEWYVLAITSSFVIMRHQTDGAIRVLSKGDLKRIESHAAPTGT